MVALIDEHQKAHGVEPICKIRPITPSRYHAHVAKRSVPMKLSDRARRDLPLKVAIPRGLPKISRSMACGKMWVQMNQ